MSRLKDMTERMLGAPTPLSGGYRRTMTGLRTGDRRELILGLVLLGFTYMRRTAPRRRLVYRQKLRTGEHVTIRNTAPGTPRLEIDDS